nr:tubuliform spidroin 1 [Nephila pilipes]
MVWLIPITFLVVLLGAQHETASAQDVSVATSVPSVFRSTSLARTFLTCLQDNIQKSTIFPAQEQEDLDDLAQVILSAVNSNTGSTSSARAQALSTALASSLVELLISESEESNTNTQISELSYILSECNEYTTGSKNPAFVSRIQTLIGVLSQSSSNIIPAAGVQLISTGNALSGNGLGVQGTAGFATGNSASVARSSASASAFARASASSLASTLGLLNQANASALASSFASAFSASSASSIGSGRLFGPSQNVPVFAPVAGVTPQISLVSPGVLPVGTGASVAPLSAQIISPSVQTALAPVLSTSGLASSSASARVSSLAESVASALSSSGGRLDVPTFLNLLSPIGSQIRASGSLDESQAIIQVLLEGLSALMHVINGAQVTSVNLASVPSVNTALATALAG